MVLARWNQRGSYCERAAAIPSGRGAPQVPLGMALSRRWSAPPPPCDEASAFAAPDPALGTAGSAADLGNRRSCAGVFGAVQAPRADANFPLFGRRHPLPEQVPDCLSGRPGNHDCVEIPKPLPVHAPGDGEVDRLVDPLGDHPVGSRSARGPGGPHGCARSGQLIFQRSLRHIEVGT